MFGLFKKNVDDLSFFIWICSSTIMEFQEHKSSNKKFDSNNVKNSVRKTAEFKKIKLSNDQENKLSLVCGVLSTEFHIDKTDEFFKIIETMASEKVKNPTNREPVIKFGEYLQRYGIFFAI
jgi:hypothetical protein